MPWRQWQHLVAGKNWFERVFSFNLGPCGCSMEKGRRESAALLGTKTVLRVEAHVLQRASRPGCVAAGIAVMDQRMDGVDVQRVPTCRRVLAQLWKPSAEEGTAPAPVLKNVVEHQRVCIPGLRETGSLDSRGRRDVLF